VSLSLAELVNTDAYDCYLRGLSYLAPRSSDNNQRAMRLFTQASALDPDYAAAYAMTMWSTPVVSVSAWSRISNVREAKSQGCGGS
jgi:hypothetical protein